MAKIKFKINGKSVEVGTEFGPDVSLNEYIRNVAELRGTKAMCHEGGCGACIVSVRIPMLPSNTMKTLAVNSCLVSVLSCHDWEITTVEGIGNRIMGYHDIQTRLANLNGSQCGYCSSGWVMNMYSLKANNKTLTSEIIENSFAGNMCRCTGYRPIADAFKTFAVDVDQRLLNKLGDLEDLDLVKRCGIECSNKCTHREKCFGDPQHYDVNKGPETTDDDSDTFVHVNEDKILMVKADSHKWYKVYNLAGAFQVMSQGNYKLIAGNTGQGVYHVTEYPPNVIDIFNVTELNGYVLDVNLILGAGMPLSKMMEIFLQLSKEKPEFTYLKQFYDHLDLVAHVSVRNIGTVAGNLYLKYANHEFSSDVFLLFETVGAMITIAESVTREKIMHMTEFLNIDMKGKIIKNISLPPLSQSNWIKTYHIMSRAQNARAIVNAGFLMKFKQHSNVIEKVSIVYGNISPSFIHATRTEKVLVGKDPFRDDTLQLALKTLYQEVNAVERPPEPSAAYRKMLAITLYYKAILSLCPIDRMNSMYKSGAETFKRSTSHGTQIFETDKNVWPLNQPVPKLEALVQCSGEAMYANDLPAQPNEVFAAFVTANTVAGSIIKDFDTTEAFKIPGVVAFYSAKDIPGKNSYLPATLIYVFQTEEILCSNKIKFFGQPAGIIVANREKTAKKAAKLVKIIYSSQSKNRPLLTIAQVLKSPEKSKRVRKDQTVEPSDKGNDVKTVINGELKIGGQYHYYMETQTCVAKSTEDGMEVYCSTQSLDLNNIAIAECLNVPINRINVIVRRVGGAYGGKITRSSQVACSAALVTHFLGKTCRMIIPMQTNMQAMGLRFPVQSNFEIGVNTEGQIQYLNNTFYEDAGYSYNELITRATIALIQSNCYNTSNWYIQSNSVLTDTGSNSWCRAPFSAEGVAMTEYMMEKIAYSVGKDPLKVRLQNMKKDNNPIPAMITELQEQADFDNRIKQIEQFNSNNRWRKRAVKLIPLATGIPYPGNFNAIVSIYHGDGSVVIIHGGIEMGQGLNTKAAQVCAYTLGIPLDKVSVKSSTSFTSPNTFPTGGSSSSESVALAVMKACKVLNDRLQPIKEKMGNPAWADLVDQAHNAGVNLQAIHTFSKITDGVKPYDVYAVAILEVEVDILTGNYDMKRLDLLEDVGRSLSPDIDVGQIEGAFVMGLGYWTSEQLKYDGCTGKLLTDRTWHYKIPGIKDIPADMRIYFKRGARNEVGVLQSKATGEPAFCLANVFTHAVLEALRAARKDAGYKDMWFDIENPYTSENIFMAVGHKLEHFKLK